MKLLLGIWEFMKKRKKRIYVVDIKCKWEIEKFCSLFLFKVTEGEGENNLQLRPNVGELVTSF
jgi:hypothetical protein